MNIIDIEPQMPRKVLDWAQTHGGMHNDCIVASDPCPSCQRVATAAFDHFYGDQPDTGAMLRAIFDDFMNDAMRDAFGSRDPEDER